MEISVVIPTYKDNVRLNLCLGALVSQTIGKDQFEVIVVNNDPEEQVQIEKVFFDQLKLSVINEIIPGSYAARNKGISKAKGRIIAFTDSDMLPDSNWLSNAFKIFERDRNMEIGILTGPVPLFYRDSNALSDAEIYDKYTGFDFEGYARDGTCGAGNWMSYKAVLEEFGGFRSDLKSNGDTDLSLKISQKYKVVYDRGLINYHPARYHTRDLVFRYQRLLGGVYNRNYKVDKLAYFWDVLKFGYRRYRFALRKFFTVPLQESWAIFKVCNSINVGVLREYFALINGRDTKR